jgi:hypothetical protein
MLKESYLILRSVFALRNLIAWVVLLAVFLIAGEGLNLFRIHVVVWLAYGRAADGVIAVLGLILAFLATAFLGGYIYYRDQKRGKLKREGWRGRPVSRKRLPRQR